MVDSLISIIIPTYNRAHLISETLDSIIAQTYVNWECIIVDDGGSDNTKEIVDAYIENDKRFKFHQNLISNARGANSCRNYGFKLCSGSFIKWFDSDDIMLPDLLEKQIISFDKDIEVSVCKLKWFDFEKNIVLKENNIFSDNLIEDYFKGTVSFYVSGPLWKRSFLEKQEELFDDTISNLDDWDFNLRMLYKNPRIDLINEALIKYRIHSDSLSQEINKLNFNEIQSEFRARDKHLALLNKKNILSFKTYIINRYKLFLRMSLVQKDKNRTYYLIKTLKSQLVCCDFLGFIKTVFSYVIYRLFNKGYKLLK